MNGLFMKGIGYHERESLDVWKIGDIVKQDTEFTYTFENFFHPFVGDLIGQLNKKSLPGMLDPYFLDDLNTSTDSDRKSPNSFFKLFTIYYKKPIDTDEVTVKGFPKEIDVSPNGPYANYNWELFFHIPLTIAVHLSKNQRFAEAQRWFHYIFDPTSNDQSVEQKKRFWKFLAFRNSEKKMTIDEIVRILSMPRVDLSASDQMSQNSVMEGYKEILAKPFQPHAVARTRHLAYQYSVVMKYLDNLIAWGDHLFQQDTIESINEATQIYVLAANILGERPQRIPPRGTIKAKTFAQLKQKGLGPIGDALVDLEGQFPFNLAAPNSSTGSSGVGDSSALFGIGRTLYFCIPPNDKLLGYWDTVADRLFKMRHCMNIEGVVRPLALFDPPIDPGMLVKAAAAGIDVGSIVSGLNQPIGPVRSLFLIQKALELCGEVRGLGGALLSALEKGDAEHLALVRQRHEIQIQQMAQEVRFLQWKQAQEATESLLRSRASTLERFRFYQRLLEIPPDGNATPDTFLLDRRELSEDNFDEAYTAFVGQYDKAIDKAAYPKRFQAPEQVSNAMAGVPDIGNPHLNFPEFLEMNVLAPTIQFLRVNAAIMEVQTAILSLLPTVGINATPNGVGTRADIFGGGFFANAGRAVASGFTGLATGLEGVATYVSKMGSYRRRADEWIFQFNLASREMIQIGRQIISSLIAEQIAHHEYLNIQQQIKNAQEVDQTLHDKFTNEDLYLWMQGEISRLYYEFYRFAFDTARKAEKTMKQELMRPEVDTQDFVKFNYWDGGRKGLLSGEALYLDVKRMEMAYHENNKRELELTKHVSLRQLNPVALLSLKATGTCQVTIPEWLYDLDCPGHYMRRIKSVALSIPSVVGPYTSVNCTLSLQKSSLRKSPIAGDNYARQGSEDDRFVDYIGAVQSIVTSSGQNDSGLFETNLRDERFLPFEGAGAESTWKLDLPKPKDYPAFDYATIADVILHIRYTARQGVKPDEVTKALNETFKVASQSNLALLFSLRHDFPGEWHRFVSSPISAMTTMTVDLASARFPYFTQGRKVTIQQAGTVVHSKTGTPPAVMIAPGQAPLVLTQPTWTAKASPGPWTIGTSEDPTLLEDIFMILAYTVD